MSNASLELGGGKWGTKDGNLLGYASSTSSSKFVPREFTFTRGSDIAATRVAANGLIEKGRENLLLQSNQFDTTWTTSSQMLTPIGGQSGYNGSSDAWKIQRSDASGRFIQQSVTEDGVRSLSVYAKAGNVDYISIVTTGSNVTKAIFKLSADGSGTNTYLDSDNISAKISHISNGWYRVETAVNETITAFQIYPSETGTSESGVVTDAFVYIQDAQLEQGLVATSYLESGATTATSGVADNEPRIDYAGGTASLLLEPSRTNLITQSEYLESPFNSLLTFNSITSPEGLVNAVKIVENTNTNMHGIRKTNIFPTNANAVVYTISVFAKKNQRDFLQIQTYADTTSINSNGFDLTNGTITGDSTNHKIEDYGNGWYRCSFTVSITQSTGGYNFIRIAIGKVNSSFYYTGDNTSGLYLYGFQFEEGSYPTSYIPTYGTSVTRSADSCLINPMDTTYSTNYTFYGEFERIVSEDEESILMQLYDANDSSNNQYRILNRTNAQLRTRIYYNGNNTSIISATDSFQLGQTIKWAVQYNSGVIKVFIDGQEIGNTTQTVGGIDVISLEKIRAKQILLFPNTLSDAECITLTT